MIPGVGAGGTVVTSPDGINWTVQYSGTLANLNDVAYGGGLFVADGNAGTIITSPDGANWTAQNSGTTNNLGRMVFASGRFTILGGALLSSLDGLNWQQDAIGYNTSFNYVYAMSGRIWASGTLGEVYQTDLIGPVLAIRKLPATNGFEVTLTGSTGAVHHVQYSAYPTGPWLDSTVQTNINGTIIWTDTNSPTSGRYYRTLSP